MSGGRLDVTPGQELPGFDQVVSRMVVRSRHWHGINTIHSDPAEAAKHGYKRPPATGQISASYIQRLCASFFGEALFKRAVLEVRFRAPVYEEDRLSVGGRVTQVSARAEGRNVTVECWCRNAEGVEVTRAHVEVLVP